MQKYFIDDRSYTREEYYRILDERIRSVADTNVKQELLSKLFIHRKVDITRLEVLEKLHPSLLNNIIEEECVKIQEYYNNEIDNYGFCEIDDSVFKVKRASKNKYYINGNLVEFDLFYDKLKTDLREELREEFNERVDALNGDITIEFRKYRASKILRMTDEKEYEFQLKAYVMLKTEKFIEILMEEDLVINGNVYRITEGENTI